MKAQVRASYLTKNPFHKLLFITNITNNLSMITFTNTIDFTPSHFLKFISTYDIQSIKYATNYNKSMRY